MEPIATAVITAAATSFVLSAASAMVNVVVLRRFMEHEYVDDMKEIRERLRSLDDRQRRVEVQIGSIVGSCSACKASVAQSQGIG